MFLLGQQLGKYQILKTLGSGGFGTVYLVKDTWIDKRFAIKVPHKQSGEMGDLLQEPRLLAAMDHKNIVRIVTAEKADDFPRAWMMAAPRFCTVVMKSLWSQA